MRNFLPGRNGEGAPASALRLRLLTVGGGSLPHARMAQVRGLAGKKQGYKDTLRVLGLTRRNQVRLVPNTASTRGALDKVKHLVTIEAEADHQVRAAVALDRLKPRPHLVARHGDGLR